MATAVRSSAPTQLETVLVQLRESIMRGRFAPGARLEEKQLAEMLGVSRTPIRIAMQSLAQEGLLVYNPHRGFQVRAFTRQDVIDAIDVRGRLEAFACELAAGTGLAEERVAAIELNLQQTRALVAQASHSGADINHWARLNEDFHRMLLEASGNPLIGTLIAQMRTIPMASAGIIPTTTSNVAAVIRYVNDAVAMHALVADAVRRRQPARAHSLMLEHVYQGRERILTYLESWPGEGDAARGDDWARIAHPPTAEPAARPAARFRRDRSGH